MVRAQDQSTPVIAFVSLIKLGGCFEPMGLNDLGKWTDGLLDRMSYPANPTSILRARRYTRYTTTIWNMMGKKDLQPSGLIGPVMLR